MEPVVGHVGHDEDDVIILANAREHGTDVVLTVDVFQAFHFVFGALRFGGRDDVFEGDADVRHGRIERVCFEDGAEGALANFGDDCREEWILDSN